MSIQSSINSLLGTSAVLARLAQPNINAKLLAKEKEETAAAYEASQRTAEEEAAGDPQKMLDILKGQAAFDESYLKDLKNLHEMSPGNTKLKEKYENEFLDRTGKLISKGNDVRSQLFAKGQSIAERNEGINTQLAANQKSMDDIALREKWGASGIDDVNAKQSLAQSNKSLLGAQSKLMAEKSALSDLADKYNTYSDQILGLAQRGLM